MLIRRLAGSALLLPVLFALSALGCGAPTHTAGPAGEPAAAEPGGMASDAEAPGKQAGEAGGSGKTGSAVSDGPPQAGPGAGAPASTTGAPSAAAIEKADDALVLELKMIGKGLDAATQRSLTESATDYIKKSKKLALPDQKVKAPRRVLATLTVEAPTGDKKGFGVKIALNGVAKDGNCPLFDLNQKIGMEGGSKENAADVAELQKAALLALFGELEDKSSNLKPNANCTPFK